MEGESILQTMAEVSVALAGFTGVVAAFGQRRERWSVLDRWRFRIMLRTSLWALVLCILPFALHHLDCDPSVTWAMSSGLLAIISVYVTVADTLRFRRLQADVDVRPQETMLALVYLLVVVVIVTQVLNTLGIGFHQSFGGYFLGVCILLLFSVLAFARLLSFVGQQFAEE